MSDVAPSPIGGKKKTAGAACQQAGLKILSSRMCLRHEYGDRVIRVYASPPDRPFEQAAISIMTIVTLSGNWPGKLEIRCAACETDSDPPRVWDIPVMRGRGAVPLEGLMEAIMNTLEEQEQVVAAMKMGVDGPYAFEETRWEIPPDPLEFF